MRIVLDSNILVLTIAPGPHVLVLSTAILLEVHRVLHYPNVQARWPLSDGAIQRYLSYLEAAGIVVDLPDVIPAVVSDPGDDPIVQTAITGRADVLCTRDQAFRHDAVQRVCGTHQIRILDDVTLMRELRPPI